VKICIHNVVFAGIFTGLLLGCLKKESEKSIDGIKKPDVNIELNSPELNGNPIISTSIEGFKVFQFELCRKGVCLVKKTHKNKWMPKGLPEGFYNLKVKGCQDAPSKGGLLCDQILIEKSFSLEAPKNPEALALTKFEGWSQELSETYKAMTLLQAAVTREKIIECSEIFQTDAEKASEYIVLEEYIQKFESEIEYFTFRGKPEFKEGVQLELAEGFTSAIPSVLFSKPAIAGNKKAFVINLESPTKFEFDASRAALLNIPGVGDGIKNTFAVWTYLKDLYEAHFTTRPPKPISWGDTLIDFKTGGLSPFVIGGNFSQYAVSTNSRMAIR